MKSVISLIFPAIKFFIFLLSVRFCKTTKLATKAGNMKTKQNNKSMPIDFEMLLLLLLFVAVELVVLLEDDVF